MKFFKVSALVLSASLFFCSCVTRGKDFSSDYSWIKEKKTSKDQVSQALGQPSSKGYSSGKPTWTYGYYKFRLFGNSETKELKIYWDGKIVDSFSFNSSFKADLTKPN